MTPDFYIMKKIKIEDLTLNEKVAQMFMFAFNGTEYNEQLKTLTEELNVGGVILFSKNIVEINQVYNLNKKIQDNKKIPLFIGLDQEGGTVLRVFKGITPFPGAMALSSTRKDTTNLCYNVGKDLVNLGFNMVFAPVGDINNNPLNPVINSRSYGDNKEIVSKYVEYAFKGFQKAGILPTIKHFPGHGDTSIDSHKSLPIVNKSYEEVMNCEVEPFKYAISKGIDGVMMSHILYPSFDKDYPASLSNNIITKLLKEQLGFKGIVVTDSLTMGAIWANFSKEEIIKNAVLAGVDMMIFCGKADIYEEVDLYNTLLNEVEKGNIPLSIIDNAVKKILLLKEKYYYDNPQLDDINKEDSIAYKEAQNLSIESITLVKDSGLIPIKTNEKVLILSSEIKISKLRENIFSDVTNKTLGISYWDEIIYNNESTNIEQIIEQSKKYDKIVFTTYNVKNNDYQVQLWNKLNKEKVIVVSLRSPYDIMYLEDVRTYICAYEATELAFSSLEKTLTGKEKFKGTLPIKIDL